MKRFAKLIVTLALGVLAVACENELPFDFVQPEELVETVQETEFVPFEGMIKLGKKLENPYSVSNMRRAFNLLPVANRGGNTIDEIQPTHLYVKFKPADVNELDMLFWLNDDIDFYSYPLDYERETGGFYRDPSLPDNVPTYYYASIPIERQIPNECDFEILEELYIPDELNDYTRTLTPSFVNAIVEQSFRLTNNEYTRAAVATRSDGQTRASYSYTGRVRVYDDLMEQYVPVPGAVMKCTRWFTTVKAITDIDGYYTMIRESQNEYNYALYWERDNKYDIRDGELNQAVSDGPKQVAAWSVDIGSSGSKRISFATITRAAYRYFYGNCGGLNKATPMATGDLKICYMHTSDEDGNLGYFYPRETLEILGNVYVYQKGRAGDILPTQSLLSTTFHEIGHATHCVAVGLSDFGDTDDFIIESWAEFVQAYLTYLEYGGIGLYHIVDYSFEQYCQRYGVGIYSALNWHSGSNSNYSALFIDLFDDYNQRVEKNSVLYPNDRIVGYLPAILNSCVNQSKTLTILRYKLYANAPSGVTTPMIDELIDFYEMYKPL